MSTVADQFAATLAAAGVKRIYGVVGDSLNGLTDALRRQDKIEWVHVRHEEVAAFAAGAEAHMTSALAVCAGSCGPGNLHLINGLFDCHRSRVPVLAIAAQIPSAEIGSGYFQETHPQTLFKECSHYCELVSGSSQMPRVLEVAIREAVGKRGVSVVVMPGDVALQAAADSPPPKVAGLLPPAPVVTPARDELDRLAELLNGGAPIRLQIARRPDCRQAHITGEDGVLGCMFVDRTRDLLWVDQSPARCAASQPAVVVFNNSALGFIELEQKSSGFINTGTELANPNFAAMAEAIGIRGIRLEDSSEVEEGIAAALAHDGPVLVDAVVNRTELAMPPSITTEMAKGFTLYMVKAVMSGRGDEVIDLARTNLWR
jgi:thiamine pyrophosphate-dependent acetolactate synthase large subunit-like protein